MRPDGPREPFAGPDGGPESPFPIKLCGPVIKGFGRGSKEVSSPPLCRSLSSFAFFASSLFYLLCLYSRSGRGKEGLRRMNIGRVESCLWFPAHSA